VQYSLAFHASDDDNTPNAGNVTSEKAVLWSSAATNRHDDQYKKHLEPVPRKFSTTVLVVLPIKEHRHRATFFISIKASPVCKDSSTFTPPGKQFIRAGGIFNKEHVARNGPSMRAEKEYCSLL
jgi:hypothetical protein